jgi:hypothetical protein
LGGRSKLTLFEYLAAGYVLMLSFAVLRAISGVPHALRWPSRYWVHVSWLLVSLALCFVAFWAFWPYRQVEWTVFKFTNVLAIPTLIYAYVSLLVPPDPASVASWREAFFRARIAFFSTGAILYITVAVSNQSALGVPPLHPSQLGNYASIAVHLIGLFSGREHELAGGFEDHDGRPACP